jgi:hypothetical protein
MAVGRKTWTVLAHEPIEVLAPNVWRVEGRLNAYNRRVMTLVRLGDGRILIHNAIALDEPSMSRIDGWGEIVAILIPNGFQSAAHPLCVSRWTCRISNLASYEFPW